MKSNASLDWNLIPFRGGEAPVLSTHGLLILLRRQRCLLFWPEGGQQEEKGHCCWENSFQVPTSPSATQEFSEAWHNFYEYGVSCRLQNTKEPGGWERNFDDDGVDGNKIPSKRRQEDQAKNVVGILLFHFK